VAGAQTARIPLGSGPGAAETPGLRESYVRQGATVQKQARFRSDRLTI
jgi:hypothetical protein